MNIRLYISNVNGWDKFDSFMRSLEEGLDDLREPLQNVHGEMNEDISTLFSSSGQWTPSGAKQWEGWSPWTEEWREPGFLESLQSQSELYSEESGGRKRKGESRKTPREVVNYYANVAGSGEKSVGVWTGGVRNAFMGNTPVGFTSIGSRSLDVGIKPQGDRDWRFEIFVRGRRSKSGVFSYYGYYKAVLEGRAYRMPTEKSLKRRGFLPTPQERLELVARAMKKKGISEEEAAVEVEKLYGREIVRVYEQPARAIYENLGLESQDPQANPIGRGFDQWFNQRYGMFATIETSNE
jgi:hypothetical protein